MRLYSFRDDRTIWCGRIDGSSVVVDTARRENLSDAALNDLEGFLAVQTRGEGRERHPLASLRPAPALHGPGQ